jgi:hypothetical protein
MRRFHTPMTATIAAGSRPVVLKATEWQRIGNQIDTAFIVYSGLRALTQFPKQL